jgi:hypothetical protein
MTTIFSIIEYYIYTLTDENSVKNKGGKADPPGSVPPSS